MYEIEQACIEALLEHLGLKDPLESVIEEEIVPDSATGKIMLIRSIVRETIPIGENLDDSGMKMLVGFAVKDAAIALARAADALWVSGQRNVRDMTKCSQSPSSPPPRDNELRPPSREDFNTYLKLLKKFASAIGFRREFPFKRERTNEADMVAHAFYVLARRRHALRQQRIPTANSNAWQRNAECNADRGDEIISLYHTIVDTVELPEFPENWTLRDKPDILENTLYHMLIDVLAVAAASEIDFDKVLAKAKAYKGGNMRW